MYLDVTENVMEALAILGKGMVGIFVVLALIMLIVLLMVKAGRQ